MSDERGKIHSRNRARQIIDFSGLRFGNITPTDIDGMIEYKNKALIYYEFKLKGNKMPDGQRLAFEREVQDHAKVGKRAIAILLEHEVFDYSIDIPAAYCTVSKYYLNPNRGWIKPKSRETALSLTEKFIRWVDAGSGIGA